MEKYNVIKQLGSGSFGRVIKVHAKHEPEVPLAIKIIKMANLSDKQKDGALNQIRLLASIDSPNVIAYHHAFFDNSNNTLNIVMEYANGGDLAAMIKRKRQKAQRFNQNFIWQVAYDLLKALKTLHNSKIIHRDIKPGNVFFVEGVAKLGDLNISKVTEGGFASTQAGTPYYTAPQIWNAKLYDGKCDIWSLGCLMYQCAALRPPFLANDFPSLMKKVNSGYCDPIPVIYSKRLSDVIKSCLRVNPRERPSPSDLMLDSVFQYMQGSEEGSVSLLNTIRCPRVLKLIQQKLPEGKSLKKNESYLKNSGRISPAPVDVRKLVSEQKPRHLGIGIGHTYEKENDISSRSRKQSVAQQNNDPRPTRGILYMKDSPHSPNVRQRLAVSPAINRRMM